MSKLAQLNDQIVDCDRCLRLREHCAGVGREKRRAYADWVYWSRPVPNFGDQRARLLLVGLAPAAHGANRTGRMFTGDRSGDWLYRALHKAGFASQPSAISRDDGLVLRDCLITAVCHCAPPANKPTRDEIHTCRPFLSDLIDQLNPPVTLCLGQIAWNSIVDEFIDRGWMSKPRAKFQHGAVVAAGRQRWLIGCYHPSQQNTFTGRLTEPMIDGVMAHARDLVQQSSSGKARSTRSSSYVRSN